LQENTYGQYDFIFKEWRGVILRKALKISNNELIMGSNVLAGIKDTSLRQTYRHTDMYSVKRASRKLNVGRSKINLKDTYLSRCSTAWKISFAFLKRKTRQHNKYQRTLEYASAIKMRNIFNKQRTKRQPRITRSLTIYKLRHKAIVKKKKRHYRLYQHITFHQTRYAHIKAIKSKLISHFFKLLRVFKKLRKAKRSSAQTSFVNR